MRLLWRRQLRLWGDVKMDDDVEDLGGSLCVQWKYSIPAYPSHFFSLQKYKNSFCWIVLDLSTQPWTCPHCDCHNYH